MPEIRLQGASIMSSVGKRIPAGMPQHMRVRLERKLGHLSGPFDHAGEVGLGEQRAALRCPQSASALAWRHPTRPGTGVRRQFRRAADAQHHVALKWAKPAFAELMMRTPIHPNPKTNMGRMFRTKTVVHVPDLAAESAYIEQREPGIVAAVEIGHTRSVLAVPMLRGFELRLSPSMVEIVTSKADDAVMAVTVDSEMSSWSGKGG